MYAKHLYLSHTSGCFEGDKPQGLAKFLQKGIGKVL